MSARYWGLCPGCGRPCVAAPDAALPCPGPAVPEYAGRLRLDREYTVLGSRFRRYVTPDGRPVEVCVRRGGEVLWSSVDAKRLARQRLVAN